MGPDGTVNSAVVDESRRDLSRLDVLHERIWLTGDRGLVAAGVLAGVLVVTTAVELLLDPTTGHSAPLFHMASAIVGGNFTLITIVISITQLVVSQQLSAPGELRAEIEGTVEYRDASIELLEEDTAPVTAPAFLERLHGGVLNSIDDLRDGVTDRDPEVASALDDLLDGMDTQIEKTNRLLQDRDSDIFDALVVTLDTNYSVDIQRVWGFLGAHGETLDDRTASSLSSLVTRLEQIDIARQYLKTLYIQEELSRLSRALLYVGVPSVLSGLGLLQMFVATDAGAFDPILLSVFVPVFVTIGAAPLAVLFAFVLRLSTVAERTVAVTPFTTPTQEHQPELKPAIDDAYAGED